MENLKSTVWIVPAADVVEMKRTTGSPEVGYKAGLTVPLSPHGNNPPTHFGQHSWESRDKDDKAMLDFMEGKNHPRINGRTKAEVKDRTSRAKVYFNHPLGLIRSEHFNARIADQGLKIIEVKI